MPRKVRFARTGAHPRTGGERADLRLVPRMERQPDLFLPWAERRPGLAASYRAKQCWILLDRAAQILHVRADVRF